MQPTRPFPATSPTRRARSLRPSAGFTLMELMITLAIIALLAAVVVPNYQEYVARGRRSSAQTQLLAAQQWMERLYSESYDYRLTSAGAAVSGGSGVFQAQPFRSSPRAGEGTASYLIAVSYPAADVAPASATSYTLTATRTGVAAKDKCGDFTLTSTGQRALVNASTGVTLSDCWK